uniref:Uncharacterized protein n=1 Tax=Amphimedon queenslandica TaxID=400682 RepID=A0A1X7SW89_AMPQE
MPCISISPTASLVTHPDSPCICHDIKGLGMGTTVTACSWWSCQILGSELNSRLIITD